LFIECLGVGLHNLQFTLVHIQVSSVGCHLVV